MTGDSAGSVPDTGSGAVTGHHRLEWFPGVVVGYAASVAAVVAAGLLLYAGPGFARSLATILTVQALALSAGFRFPHPEPDRDDGIRLRWILGLVSFLVATVYGTVWTLSPALGSGRWGQGTGLAFLAGLPLYACAVLFAGLAQEGASAADTPPGRSRLAAQGAVGAAMGFAAAGVLLPRAPTPSSLLVTCLVVLSLGGMAYASVRGSRSRSSVIARGCKGPPPVYVEEYVPPGGAPAEWRLMEGPVVRARLPAAEEGRSVVPTWDEDLVAAFGPASPEATWRSLHLGGGGSRAATGARSRCTAAEVTVLERAHCLVELGKTHFGTGLEQEGGEVRVALGNWEDQLRTLEPGFDLIVVDGRALEAVGGMSALSGEGRRLVLSLLAPGGVAAWGPKAVHHPRNLDPDLWSCERRDRVPFLDEVMLVRRAPSPVPSGAPPAT